jgi:hypothetical protein
MDGHGANIEAAAAGPVDWEQLFLPEVTKQVTPNHLIRLRDRINFPLL